MMQLRKTQWNKIISFVLVFLFILPVDILPGQMKNAQVQFERAKSEYQSGKYEKAAQRLERLAALYENVKNQIGDIKIRYGQTLLLLGASQENLQWIDKAEESYSRAKELLGKNFVIPGMKFKGMKIYRKAQRSKIKTK